MEHRRRGKEGTKTRYLSRTSQQHGHHIRRKEVVEEGMATHGPSLTGAPKPVLDSFSDLSETDSIKYKPDFVDDWVPRQRMGGVGAFHCVGSTLPSPRTLRTKRTKSSVGR